MIVAAKHAFPYSKICISSMPLSDRELTRVRAQQMNDYMRHTCVQDARLLFIPNESLNLWHDGIHLTFHSKSMLAKNIAHVIGLTKCIRQRSTGPSPS